MYTFFWLQKRVSRFVFLVWFLSLAAERVSGLRRTRIDGAEGSACRVSGLAFLRSSGFAKSFCTEASGGLCLPNRRGLAGQRGGFLLRRTDLPETSAFAIRAVQNLDSDDFSPAPMVSVIGAASRGVRRVLSSVGGCAPVRSFASFLGRSDRRCFALSGGRGGDEGQSEDPTFPAFSRTKQVATIGPASWDFEQIEGMFLNGVDVFRLNMSHGLYSEKHQQLLHVREIERKHGAVIGVLADLPGPKLRLGMLEGDEVILEKGARFVLDSNSSEIGSKRRASISHPQLIQALREGDKVLLDDGKLELRVDRNCGESVECTVVVGGPLSSKKGANFPSAKLPISALTEKDREIARMVVDWGVDFLALSFVQSAADVYELRKLIDNRVPIIAKVEKIQALDRLSEIAEAADALMVARGDLGLELPFEKVPEAQRRIIAECRRRKKPVIVATQMLESLLNSPRPTRAEASDVATAVLQGADAVMLSGETAASPFSGRNVNIQRRILSATEETPDAEEAWTRRPPKNQVESNATTFPLQSLSNPIPTAVAAAAGELSRCAKASFVAALSTHSVGLALAEELSSLRLRVPVLALSDDVKALRRLQLRWGVNPVLLKDGLSWEQTALRAAQEMRLARQDENKLQSSNKDLLVLAEAGTEGTSEQNVGVRLKRIQAGEARD